jgi:hypothetical protein
MKTKESDLPYSNQKYDFDKYEDKFAVQNKEK